MMENGIILLTEKMKVSMTTVLVVPPNGWENLIDFMLLEKMLVK